jgi:hypothetical protein
MQTILDGAIIAAKEKVDQVERASSEMKPLVIANGGRGSVGKTNSQSPIRRNLVRTHKLDPRNQLRVEAVFDPVEASVLKFAL